MRFNTLVTQNHLQEEENEHDKKKSICRNFCHHVALRNHGFCSEEAGSERKLQEAPQPRRCAAAVGAGLPESRCRPESQRMGYGRPCPEAKDLLDQANNELKQAAEAANKNAK